MPGPTFSAVVSSRPRRILVVVGAAGLSVGLAGAAHAAEVDVTGAVTVAGPTSPAMAAPPAPTPPAPAAPAPPPAPAPAPVAPPAPPPGSAGDENLIPPNVEGTAVRAAGGGYCYGGPHPAPGGGWEAVQTP